MKITIIIEEGKNEVKILNKTEELTREDKTDCKSVSNYARFFDASCPGWDKNPEYNLLFLRQQQTYASNMLKLKGHLFLNEVYELLGIPHSQEGSVVGQIYDEKNPIGDNYVDFGIYDERNANFVNGYERSILLDFNVDGCILDKI